MSDSHDDKELGAFIYKSSRIAKAKARAEAEISAPAHHEYLHVSTKKIPNHVDSPRTRPQRKKWKISMEIDAHVPKNDWLCSVDICTYQVMK